MDYCSTNIFIPIQGTMNNSQIKSKTGPYFFIVFLCIFVIAAHGEARDISPVTVEIKDGNLRINAHDARLGDLLDEISSVCKVTIKGLSNREDETVSFVSGDQSVECELKRLLQYLNVGNYSFEYGGDQLRTVSVFPSSNAADPARPVSSLTQQKIKKRQSKVVSVEGILEGSQAEALNLMEGDLVVSYDNTRISTARQLIKLVKSKSDLEKIDMIVIRDGNPLRLVVDGGQIGIHIKTVKIPSEALKRYHSSY